MMFIGKVNDGNFSAAVVGKKKGNRLANWDGWTMNRRFGPEIVTNTWESGIQIRNSSIDVATQTAILQFSRPLVT